MTAIPHAALIRIAADEFADVTELAASSRRGCVAARRKLKIAAKHGLTERAYIVRDRMCYGWGTSGVEPLFGMASAPDLKHP